MIKIVNDKNLIFDVWKYDVILDTINMIYDLKDDSKAKYAGGLTLPNGEIVFVPATSSTIMVLKPERYMRIPESFLSEFTPHIS